MKVTSNKLFNYIRCRRFAALHDPNSETDPLSNDHYYLKSMVKFKDIFLGLNYQDSMNYEKDVELSFDFHHDFQLTEVFDFIFNDRDIYVLVTESSKHFLNIKYREGEQTHQIFKKNDDGQYQLVTGVKNSESYHSRFMKLMGLNEITGQIIFKYAFMRYLYRNIYPKSKFNLYVVMLNEDYVHSGLTFNKKLYHVFDFSNIDDLDNQIEIALFRMINHIELNDFTPCELVRNACMIGKKNQCKFVDFCYSHLPKENSILDYFEPNLGFSEPLKHTKLHHDTYELINHQYLKMEDIPLDWISNKNRLMQRYCLDNKVQYINKEKIKLMLSGLTYPLTFLDLSLMPTIIPKFKGEKPFETLGFQYSIYYQKNPDSHFELNDDQLINSFKETRTDTRTEFAERFVNHLLKHQGSIVVYNKPRLSSVFQSMKIVFPSIQHKIDLIIEHLVDVLDILTVDSKYLKQFDERDLDLSTYNFYDLRLSGSYDRNRLAKVFDLDSINQLEINDDETEYKTFRLYNDFQGESKIKAKKNMMIYSQHKAYLLYQIVSQLYQKVIKK